MDSLPLEFHPDAQVEAIQAHNWYAERSISAAEAFQDELQKAGRAIQIAPSRWALYLHGTRQYIMKRFPYVVVYRVSPHRIEIVAVAHGKRKPAIGNDG
ncbi:MAG: type II toxin-antitoxin system RelE/ParE family toxin [Planctomycetaceae bacterium]